MRETVPDAVREVRTTCAYCGVGCGMLARVGRDGLARVVGDPRHPANHGRLCAKGAALGDTLGHGERLLHPRIAGRRVGWDTALARVADEFNAVIARHGPHAVGFYVSGQLLTEDYYVANKLMKGFIGGANIDTNSRLCMASSVAGHRRAFGEDVVPGVYADFEEADLVVLVGSNLAWCHPVLQQRLLAARAERGTRIVVIDPRATATSSVADLHLRIAPGSDVALFNGLLRHLHGSAAIDSDYLARHTQDYAAAARVAQAFDVERVGALTALPRDALTRFYAWFVEHARTVTAWSQGVNQSSAGTDKVNAIINCHLLTGRIGKPGAGPFSLTGQPNAMGGREVGGLANQLAAHVEFGDRIGHARLAQFWRSPRLARQPGLKAVDMFRAVADGRIQALWIMGTNPAVSLPATAAVRTALAGCPFVVVSDVTAASDTAATAHVLLPAAGWGEKDGTVTNSERRISRQRGFMAPPGEARPDWWIVNEVARRMGHAEAFDFRSPAEIFREHAALSGWLNGGRREFNLGRFAQLDEAAYGALSPQQWPCGGSARGESPPRLFADGRFPTSNGRARFVATPFRPAALVPDARRPLVLNSGRMRDQWHTMTRSGLAPRLSAHIAEPYVEIHPETAARAGIAPAELAVLENDGQRLIARALVTTRQSPGSLFVPMHWSGQHAGASLLNTLLEAVTDPVSGQPELKHGRVALAPYRAAWYAFAVSAADCRPEACDYWARMRVAGGWRFELAHAVALDGDALFGVLCGGTPSADLLHYRDAARGEFRCAAFVHGRLYAALFMARTPVAVARAWLVERLARYAEPAARAELLAAAPAAHAQDHGEIVCVCNQVGQQAIRAAVRAGQVTLARIAAGTGAGGACGACRGEVQRIIDASAWRHAV